jgi:hypothetical protein
VGLKETTVMDAKLTKAQVLTTLQAERRAWDALLAEVGDARMSAPLPGGPWSPKDLLARVAWYEQELAAVLEAAPPPAQRAWLWALPEAERNAIVDREQRAGSVAAVRAAAQAAFTHLVAVVAALDAAAGQDGARFPTMPAGWTPWQFIAANSYEHYRAYTPALRAWLDAQPAPAPPPAPVAAGVLVEYAPASVTQGIRETVRVQHSGATSAERQAIEQELLADLGYTSR